MKPRTLQNTDIGNTRKNTPDLFSFGNGDLWQLLCKASSQQEGWMKSTKAMQVPGGCLVQVTTQQKGYDETYSVAEALTYVPGVEIADAEDGGRCLVAIGTPARLHVAAEPEEPKEEVEDLVAAAVEVAEPITPKQE